MDASEVLQDLEAAGTEQNRKVYRRHGVGTNMYGVSYANLRALAKKIKKDHEVALALWASGNHDARVLATMIAAPEKGNGKLLAAWIKDLDNYVLTDAFSGYAARTPVAVAMMEKWISGKSEWVATTGWNVLAILANTAKDLPDSFFSDYLPRIESEIHRSKNRVRHAMNGALIAIGLRNEALREKALAVASAVGTVEVDHGETNCQTPHAGEYIRKATNRKATSRS